MSDVDPIIVAGDGGEVLDETDDGSITFATTADGEGRVRVDTTTEFGRRIERAAREQCMPTEEFVNGVIEEFIEGELGE